MAAPADSIIRLHRELIRIPTQAGLDPAAPLFEAVGGWLSKAGLAYELLGAGGEPVALIVEVRGRQPGPTYCLNAPVDTAPFGDSKTWRWAPTDPRLEGGWLYGRGSADCKAAIALFLHIAKALARAPEELCGAAVFVFDADEHTGGFRGIHAAAEAFPDLDGVMVGYPGNDRLFIGARGFFRAELEVIGRAAHSGSPHRGSENAVTKAALLIARLSEADLADEDPRLKLPPSLTVTQVRGGRGYSMVPDLCTVGVDVRLTLGFDAAAAEKLLRATVDAVDAEFPTPGPTRVTVEGTFPAYRLADSSPLVSALSSAAARSFAREVPVAVCGPSNVGNYLALQGIDATCGFGVTYENLHGANERIRVDTIPQVYETYLSAIRELLG